MLASTSSRFDAVYLQQMAALFSILLIASMVLLVWGLIAPQHFAKHAKDGKFTRRTAGIGFGSLVLVLVVLIGITAPPQTPTASQHRTVNLTTSSHHNQQSPQKTLGDTVTTQLDTETKPIPFTTTAQDSVSLALGQTRVTQLGQNGIETLTYNVTYTNGQQTSKDLVTDLVTTPPVNEIVEHGTYVAPPPPAPAPTPNPTPSPNCYPLTNGGNCYEPGEYCRNTDHGLSGVAGDGKSITCTYNNGWRWEPY